MKLRLTSLALLLALMGAFVAIPRSASAAPSSAPAAATMGISVPINITNAAAKLVGTFNIDRFVVQNGGVAAVGTLTGTLTNLATGATRTINQALTLPVLDSTTGTCQILHLELGPIDLNLLGLRIQTNKIVLDITAQSGPGNLLGNLLCGIANLLNNNRPAGLLAGLLNGLLGALDANPTTGIPIVQTVGGSTFTGVLDLTSFAVQGGKLVATGTLAGVITNAAGVVTGTVNRVITLDVLDSTTGTCQILHLELGPLDLNLLGLRIQLNKVVLDITAQSGPGNLLGNLLCAVARLLDRNGALGGVAAHLNSILRTLP